MLTFQKWRPLIAIVSAAIFVVSGMMPLGKLMEYIDFNVLLMIAGTMGTVALVIESKMPFLLSDIIVEKVPNVKINLLTKFSPAIGDPQPTLDELVALGVNVI